MQIILKPVNLALLVILYCAAPLNVLAQQTIMNPLIRPAATQANATPPAAGAGAAATAAPAEGAANSDEVRRQAERRITQEDLNVRQQSLNLPVLPAALVNLFANMQVTAHLQGFVVMRRIDRDVITTTQAAPVATGNTAQGNGDAGLQTSRPVLRSSAVLRLRVGKTENISGYKVRAMLNGQDITVDWLSDNGVWVNVFFGALESSAGGVPQVPTESQLLKVETEQFDHLVPVLRTQTFSPSGTLGGQQGGNNGSGLGGGNQGFNQPGFGTGFPN